MSELNLTPYQEHEGTVKMAGSTIPRKAAWRAFQTLESKVPNVEFLFVGASAGQQTVKAIGILSEIFEQKYPNSFAVLFRPLRYKTTIHNERSLIDTRFPAGDKEVDAQVWRVHVIDLDKTNETSSGC